MNERIKALAEQAGYKHPEAIGTCEDFAYFDLERFAELIREDETKACADHYLGIMRDAVEQARADEREACAQLCDELARQVGNKNFIAVDQRQFCAKQIRAKGEQV